MTVGGLAVTSGSYQVRVSSALPSRFASVQRRTFEGREVTIARRSDFRLRWFAVRLTTTLVLAEMPDDADVAALDAFLAATVKEASRKDVVAGLGLQRGAAAIAAAVFASAPAAAREWASTAHGHRFGVTAYPVVVDLATGELTQPKRMRAGRVFQGHLRRLATETLSPRG
jgi:hypothetical protein